MSMWTTQRNGRAKSLIAVLFGTLIAGGLATAGVPLKHGHEPTPKEISVASDILLSLFAQRDDMPDGRPGVDMKRSYFRWDSSQSEKRMLVVAKVNFPESANSYCRLVIVSDDLSKAFLIPVSAKANYDDCARVSRPVYVDINGDNISDIAYEVEVKSNRYPQDVAVPMIYLSTASSEGGYCYASELSGTIEPKDMSNATALQSRTQKEIQRQGRGILQCETQ